jgi:electron transfer flavoprotein beta subunit
MKIVVLIKVVPDSGEDRLLNLETGLLDRAASEPVIDEIGERALEVALQYADRVPGTEIAVVSMGPESAQSSLRRALAIGADMAVQVVDDELLGADLLLTADTIAAALRRIGFDLVLTGDASTDGGGGVLPVMIAELLDVPAMTALSSITIADDTISGTREWEGASADVTAMLPAVASVTETLPEARFPDFKGIMAAKKKPIEVLSLSDLSVEALPSDTARSIMVAISQRPPRTSGTIIADDGEAGRALADFLLKSNLA